MMRRPSSVSISSTAVMYFELLAISDYVAQHKCPILSLAAAEDMTQRKPNPYFVRASGHLGLLACRRP